MTRTVSGSSIESSGTCASARMYRCDSGDVDDIGWPFVSSVRPCAGVSVDGDDFGQSLARRNEPLVLGAGAAAPGR